MRDAAPLVSIIVPAYNAERFLLRALRSALEQTYDRLEILVVDDGSTDRTAEIARGIPDGRVRVLSQPNQGQGPARNRGIRESRGDYITFLDADDFYLSAKVAREVAWLEARPEYGAVFCDALHFYAHDPSRVFRRPISLGDRDVFHALLHASLINPNTLMVRGDVLRRGFFFREDRYFPEEWDLCLRLLRAGVRFGYVPEDLAVVEVREDSNTTMEIQWILKRNALSMFERLFGEMSESERAALGAPRILRRCRLNLAAAYLANGDKPGFNDAIARALPGPASLVLRAVVSAVPAPAVKSSTIRIWRWRQRRSFERGTRRRDTRAASRGAVRA